MVCPTNSEKLLDYCAQRADAAWAAEFDQHLKECGECRSVVAAQRDVWETLDRWTPPEVSPDFDARLYARIAAEKADSPWTQWWRKILHPPTPLPLWKPAVSLALACAVLAVGLFVRMPDPGDTAKQVRSDKVDIEQVEQTLDDLEILAPAS